MKGFGKGKGNGKLHGYVESDFFLHGFNQWSHMGRRMVEHVNDEIIFKMHDMLENVIVLALMPCRVDFLRAVPCGFEVNSQLSQSYDGLHLLLPIFAT